MFAWRRKEEETKSRNILGVVRLNKKNRTWCSSNAKMHTQILRKRCARSNTGTLLTRVRLSESFHCRDLSLPKEEQAQDEYLVEDTTESILEIHKVDTNEKEKELHSKLDLLLRLHEGSEKKICKPLKRKTEEKREAKPNLQRYKHLDPCLHPVRRVLRRKKRSFLFLRGLFHSVVAAAMVLRRRRRRRRKEAIVTD